MQLVLSCSPYRDSNVMQERNHADIKENKWSNACYFIQQNDPSKVSELFITKHVTECKSYNLSIMN